MPLAAVVFGAAWAFGTSGAGWAPEFVVGAVIAAGLLDLLVAFRATNHAAVEVLRGMSDATVGAPVEFLIAVTGGSFHLRIGDHALSLHGIQVAPPATATLRGSAARRGVLTHLDLVVWSNGFAGLIGCVGSRRVPLPAPLFVGPRPVDPGEPLPQVVSAALAGTAQPAATGDIVRGVRPYVHGDSLRRIHWPASARTGELVVMEVQEPSAPMLAILVSLGAGGDAGEQAAGRAAWYAAEALRREYRVQLGTLEAGGPVAREVTSFSEVNRRLAAAVPGPLRSSDSRGRLTVVEVTDEGDRWV